MGLPGLNVIGWINVRFVRQRLDNTILADSPSSKNRLAELLPHATMPSNDKSLLANLPKLKRGRFFLEGKVWFEKFKSKVQLHVDAPAVAQMTSHQMKAIREFANWPKVLFRRMETPLYCYYEYSAEQREPPPEKIARKGDVWNHLTPCAVLIPEFVSENNAYVSLELNCTWDIEHGVQIVVRNKRDILYVGPYYMGRHISPEQMRHLDSNFAS